jgi:single-strand DNA-binding protein
MSRDLNKVMVIGRLGKDPETRYTPQGSAMTRFSVASSRRWRTAEGEDREDTEWFNIVAWDKLAETCAQYLQKGARVYIEGRLQTRSWDDQQTGQKRYMTEVVANDMIMLDSRRDSMNAGGGSQFAEPDVGFPNAEPELEAPARSFAQNGARPQQAQRPAPAANGNGSPPRPAQRPTPVGNTAPRRPAAPPTTDEDDLPF